MRSTTSWHQGKHLAVVIACLGAHPAFAQDVRTTISGTVFDSVARRPLSGAVVQLVRASKPSDGHTVLTAADGRFRFDGVDAGAWILGFLHPVLDSLGLPPPILRVSVREPTPVRTMLSVPAPATIIRLRCGASADSGGLWYGRTRSAITGLPVPSVRLAAQWNTIVARGNVISRQTPVVTMESSDDGTFQLCYMPAGELVAARAWTESDSSGVLTFSMPNDAFLRRDVFIGPVSRAQARLAADSAAGDSAVPVMVRTGRGQVRGRVSRSGGSAVPGARMRFTETGAETTTNENGFFAFDSLPLGSFTVDARAIGFLPAMTTVDVLAGAVTTADFVLESRQTYLDTVKVITDRVYDTPQYRDFLQRRKGGFGYFYDEDAIERRNPLYLSDMLRMTPGVTVLPGGFGGRIRFRSISGTAGAYCVPAVFVDGMLVSDATGGHPQLDDMGLDALVNPGDVRAMEVYTRVAGMPAQYQTMNGCGSLLVWTGQRTKRTLPP